MSLDSIIEKMKSKMAYAGSLNARVLFDCGDSGFIFVDATQTPPILSHEEEEADTILSCDADTLSGILDGTQDPNIAFMMGKLKIKGNMGVAMKLNAILED